VNTRIFLAGLLSLYKSVEVLQVGPFQIKSMFTYGNGGARGHSSVSRHKELKLQYLFLGPVDLWLSKVDWVPSRDS
jgi:hypothetical protein